MKKTNSPRSDELRAKAEAAAWLSRLQQSPIPDATRAGFQAWLSEDRANEIAFENATLVWDILPGAVKQGVSDSLLRTQYRPAVGRGVAALAACLLFVCALSAFYFLTTNAPLSYATVKGQEMSVVLSDQSRVTLNTDSLVEIAFNDHERLVRLVRGEAMFEVAKDPKHPFIVDTGYDQVRALGTTFVVRKDEHETSATLIEGRVEVFQDTGKAPVILAVLKAGQRITVTGGTKIAIDYPSRDMVMAWTMGQVIFEDEPLGDAIEELNRYGSVQLEIDDPIIASLHVSGDFTTRDPVMFARAVAALYHLRLEWDANNIRFAKEPVPEK